MHAEHIPDLGPAVELTRPLATYRAPPMPPDLLARIERALAAETARRPPWNVPQPRTASADS